MVEKHDEVARLQRELEAERALRRRIEHLLDRSRRELYRATMRATRGGGPDTQSELARFLIGITTASHALLAGDADAGRLARALEILGAAADVDLAYVLRITGGSGDDPPPARLLGRWSRSAGPDDAPGGAGAASCPDLLALWLPTLSDGRSAGGAIDSLDAREREAFEALGLRSALAIPILVNGSLWGVLGLDCRRRVRPWAREERLLLERVADDIVHASNRRRAARELKEAKERAEQNASAQSLFLASTSHELRTPLNAIIGISSLLLDTPLDESQQEFVEMIRTGGDTLLAIINDILDYSKIEADRLELERLPFDLRDCVESSLDLLVASAAEKRLALIYFIEDDTPEMIVGDATRFRQVLINLVANAVKFTERGHVSVFVSHTRIDDAEVRIQVEVRDTGPGIPESEKARLFEAFTQLETSTTRRYGGTGLGLAIARRLVERMGGEIDFDSTLGEGSTFRFTIVASEADYQPLKPIHSRHHALTDRRLLIIDDNADNRRALEHYTGTWGMRPRALATATDADLFSRIEPPDLVIYRPDPERPDAIEGPLRQLLARDHATRLLMLTSGVGADDPQSERATASLPVKPGVLLQTLLRLFDRGRPRLRTDAAPDDVSRMGRRHPLRILVVEDNPVNQRVALHMLQRLGYRADVASSGEEALIAVRQLPYEVVLMDIQMPGLDGGETTRRIRAMLDAHHQPHIIATTAFAMAGDQEHYLGLGMDGYISKPVRIEDLIEALQRVAPRTPTGKTGPLDLSRAINSALPDTPVRERTTLRHTVEIALDRALGEDATREERQSVLELYFKDAGRLVTDLDAALAGGDLEVVRRVGHTIAGNSAIFGMERLTELGRALEDAALNADLEAATRLREELARIQGEYRSALFPV